MQIQTPKQYFYKTRQRQSTHISPNEYRRNNLNISPMHKRLLRPQNPLSSRNNSNNRSFTSGFNNNQKPKYSKSGNKGKSPLYLQIRKSPDKSNFPDEQDTHVDSVDRLLLKQVNSTKNTKLNQRVQTTRSNFAIDTIGTNKSRKDSSLNKNTHEVRNKSNKKIDYVQEPTESPLIKILQTRRFKKPKVSNPISHLMNIKLKNLQLRMQQPDEQDQKKKSIYIRQYSNSKPKYQEMESFQRLKFKTYLNQLINYEYISQLGRGGYARVILTKNIHNNMPFAVKIYDKLKLQSKSKISNIKRQISIMETLQHQNISAFKQYFQNKTTVYIVMQYCGSNSLFAYINSFENSIVPERKAKYIFSKVISAIKYMQQKKIAHRDIKAQNILIINDTIKIIDFGFSIFISPDQKINTYCGTPTYMSPQIVSRQPYDAFYSDVWSLGVLLYLILQGKYPFMSKDQDILFQKIKRGRYKFQSQISAQAEDLIRSMLQVDPLKRIQISHICESKWFQK